MSEPAAVMEVEQDPVPAGVPVRFVVQRPFKYGTRIYSPGDDFIPNGGKFDALLLKHHCKQVRLVNGVEVIR